MKNLLFISLLLFAGTVLLIGQEGDDTQKKDARLSITFINENNLDWRLSADVKIREGRSYIGAEDVEVQFFAGDVSSGERIFLGSQQSTQSGVATLTLSESSKSLLDTIDQLILYAIIDDDAQVNDNEEVIEVSKSYVELFFEEIDSVKTVKFFIGQMMGDSIIPMEDIESGIYLQRLFGMLPLIDYEYTDDEGFITVELPSDLRGDVNGNLNIYGIAEDTDDLGTLKAYKSIDWGLPLTVVDNSKVRELWSPGANAPLYLVFIVSFMLLGIWGIIAYLILQIFKIKNLGRINI